MKNLKKIFGISLLAFLLIVTAPRKSMAQEGDITEQDFYDNLEPYGTWVSDAQYGDVWVPDVDEDFRPYATQGHWVLTEYGNTWVSDYPWGWATFHYGRWRYDDYYGWEWIPGYEWAPAWVSWREGGGYYGWAPLMPGVSIDLSFGSGYDVPDTYWSFAPYAYINQANIYNYYVPHNRVINIIHRTKVINNTYSRDNRRYIAGPRATDIQRYTHKRPQVYTINNASRPGAINVHNKTVNMFRPSVRKAPDARPSRVVDANAYRQQNPNQGIARKGANGAAGFNHANAAKLAAVARSTNDNHVVRVNPARPGNRPAQPGNTPNNAQPGNKPNPAQPSEHRGRPENRPNITPPAQQNRPGGTAPANDAAQQAQREQQRAQRQQQQQNHPAAAPVNDAAQQAQRTQQRVQREQQRQQNRPTGTAPVNDAAQQAQREQQRAQREQQKQAQQSQVQQQQQQAQRQQQQQAQQQQRQQQQQAQQQQRQQQQRQMQQQQHQMQQRQQQPRPEEHRP